MTQSLISLLAVGLFLSAAWGWGRWLERLCLGRTASGWGFPAALGMAAWVAVGGVLNLAGLARPWALAGLLGAGLILAALAVGRALAAGGAKALLLDLLPAGRPGEGRMGWLAGSVAPAGAALGAGLFAALTVMPAAVFNHHDDLHTYLVRPLQMLATGRLGVDPLGMFGLDSLGGQAFLQGFFAAWLPLDRLCGLDTVACFTATAALAVEEVRRGRGHPLVAWAALVVVLGVNPQIVNVSPVYSASLAILALASALLRAEGGEGKAPGVVLRAVPAALLLNMMVVAKSTLVFFAAAFFVPFAIVAVAMGPERRAVALRVFASVALSLVAFAPWALLHGRVYAGSETLRSLGGGVPGEPGGALFSQGAFGRFLAGGELFHGDTYFAYDLLVLAMLAVVGVALWEWRRERTGGGGPIAVLAGASLGAVGAFVTYSMMFAPQAAIRYACPVVIGAFPAVLAVWSGAAGTRKRALAWAPGAAVILLVGTLFAESALARVERMAREGHALSFPVGEDFRAYGAWAMGGEAKAFMASLQGRTEAGTGILAWVAMPMHLDFQRNRVIAVSELGLWSPLLADLPRPGDVDGLRRLLAGQGIRYVIWDYRGAGMKPPVYFVHQLKTPYVQYRRGAFRYLSLYDTLKVMTEHPAEGTVLYADGTTVVLDLGVLTPPS